MAKKRGWDGFVPFNQQGDLLSYAVRGKPERIYDRQRKQYIEQTVEWRPRYEFEATLTYEKCDKGIRSAYRLIFKDEETGSLYPMFISELKHTLQNAIVNGDKFTGQWTFRKQGQNFSICHVRD